MSTQFQSQGRKSFRLILQLLVGLLWLCAAFNSQTPVERPELILQTGHAQKAEALAFSRDGRFLATGSSDRTIKIWETQTGRELRTLQDANTGIKALAFSPNGATLAAGGNDGKLRIWDVASAQVRGLITAHRKPILALAFHPNGRQIATGGAEDGVINLWDLPSNQLALTLKSSPSWVTSLSFSPNGQTLAAGSADGTLTSWETANGRERFTAKAQTDRIRCLTFSADSEILVAGGNDGETQSWRVRSGQLQLKLPKQIAPVIAISFTSNESQLLTCTNDQTIALYDVKTGQRLSIITVTDQLNRYETALFSPDGNRLAAGDGTRNIVLRSTANTTPPQALESRVNPVKAVAFSPDGRWLATGHQDTSITLWETFSGRAVAMIAGDNGSINSLTFSPDSQWLASGSRGGVIRLWDAISMQTVRSWTAQPEGINAMVFTPDGQRLYSAGQDASIVCWEASSGRKLATLSGHQSEITSLGLSQNGQWLVSAGADQAARLWDTRTNQTLRTFQHTGSVPLQAALQPDGKLLVTASNDRVIQVWDATTGQIVRALKPPPTAQTLSTGALYALALAADGQTVAVGNGTTTQLWDINSGQLRATLSGHAGTVNSLGFSNDGEWLLSGSEDGSARLWQVTTQTAAATIVALSNSQDWLVVTPDGLFDGSPAAWNQILWRFARQTFNVAPVELFFNEFFYPELLADVLNKRRPPVRENIAQLDRRQPQVTLALAENTALTKLSPNQRTVKVRVNINEAPRDAQHTQGSGAQDVRLFRNGALVKVWRGDVLRGQAQATLETDVTLVAGANQLTAYAFNRANIKSADAQQTLPAPITLARRGIAYLIAVGVNQYSNPGFNLKYAVADAQTFSAEWQQRQSTLNQFARIESVLLLDQQATKANLRAALQRLSGQTSPLPANAPAALQRLQPTQPEDAVIVYFAGHGIALNQRFYLLPHELGYNGKREALSEADVRRVLPLAVSDEELEALFEPLEAGHLLLVLDACNSGQALEAEEQRRGPMNTKGLAQLAYEKGMNILTAAQSYQAAQENATLGHGYLTYALIEDGLKKMSADRRPRDGQLLLREWFDYATAAVPQLQAAKVQGERLLVKKRLQRLQEVQRPRVFYRRETEAKPLIIGQN